MLERPDGVRGEAVTTRRRRAPLAAALAVAVLLLGCAGADSDDDGTGQTAQDADMDERPDPAADLPEEGTEPPAELVIEDLKVGDGEEATAGSTVVVHYVGVGWSSRQEFDASWDRGQPLTFQLGSGMVIAGWDQGVQGMREGGRRRLVIPPQLAYGDRGASGVIAPGETLVFDVDLLDVQPGR